jgi:hypothetical protein
MMTVTHEGIVAALETLIPQGGWSATWTDDLELEELIIEDSVENPPTLDEVLAQAAIEQPQIPWRKLRRERDRLLTESDWMVSSDRTASAEQTAYRQALRDLPANTTDPANPVWPVKPE